jgi:hypothetical protein
LEIIFSDYCGLLQLHQTMKQSSTLPSHRVYNLQSATTARALSAGAVGGDGGDVLDAADLQAGTGKGAEGGLSTRAGGLGSVTTSGTDLHVDSGDTELLGLSGGIHGGKHSSVGGGLVTISLHLHTTGDSAKGLSARKISDVLNKRQKRRYGDDIRLVPKLKRRSLGRVRTHHKGIVERSENVSNSEVLVTLRELGGQRGDLLNSLLSFNFSLQIDKSQIASN